MVGGQIVRNVIVMDVMTFIYSFSINSKIQFIDDLSKEKSPITFLYKKMG